MKVNNIVKASVLLVASSINASSQVNAFVAPSKTTTFTAPSFPVDLVGIPIRNHRYHENGDSRNGSARLNLNLNLKLKLKPLFMDPSSGIDFADSASSAWASYNLALEESPLLTKSVTAGVILGAADFAGQAFENRKSQDDQEVAKGLDVARVARFAFFGFILQAPWNHFYYQLLDGALPPTEDPFTATTGIKVVIDQFVQAPIFTVIIFGFLGFLEGKSLESIKEQLDRDYKDTMLANWKLWVPATAVNIAFCPPILRVLFLNCVFFFWSIFLSLKLNNSSDEEA